MHELKQTNIHIKTKFADSFIAMTTLEQEPKLEWST